MLDIVSEDIKMKRHHLNYPVDQSRGEADT